jgi:predicted dinucleotide-binding enzyme
MRAIDAGSLADARHLEGIELIHLRAQSQIEGNFASAISFIS